MKIYPAIDMINGQVVRLTKGLFDQKTIYNDNPVQMAKEFQAMGATYLHVVDLDGAKQGAPQQTKIIRTIAEETKLKLQVGGGVRSAGDVSELLDAGVDRVIIGSLAVKDMAATKRILETFGGERITLGLDVSLNDAGTPMVATHGWQEVSNLTADEVLNEYLSLGLSQVLCTDISRDGTLTGPNFELYKELSLRFPTVKFLASGGLKSVDQVKALKADNVGGAIIGKAIYEGTLDLREALIC
ncbi:1-(5-phosphoribosyl)-5-[(5-phosphoribosylamino)methylideneamino]imidazole-4-carboxamide isomerase [Pseudobacteriovorax antillogorgiicola]|uniref:1-(5-phosphoribosyl)-5-[(5-phosphoribosylamino)methylideneamino] imidazole-4-carboxamide isomerase n=1 Tax=Pseudobacteriovorax antillogorgiicola TaxID=1513793 RepID=A0A1Y6CTJ2_9BACT|nr:1-(5-phosphoribosyl)-5-[(5-phosphoribosylamino)methylideneamino]imidazole-4-carboxamide isomerase [Pseudobacteriovorax antillogorgiicola]TCS44612.1 1-(5-phosphoribosyl)-5-[(5-phosphoribosylamino)methylideneamino] imidazole-4-carboxamide isomerase [Pseudobacteriovorax antillogorgiicola]SMF78285.1 1-(5-phosphoribosyl)-5-[(5-phosphoribosylamino)methylideneamino] imidazole-4-carboxamide isomerase [Pseudobacteriovorax antillogorgiicola]